MRRLELVVRIVDDVPDKLEEPIGRKVLQEVAIPMQNTWDLGPPSYTGPTLPDVTDSEIMLRVVHPIAEEMRKAPFGMLIVQCVQALQRKWMETSKIGVTSETWPASPDGEGANGDGAMEVAKEDA